MDKRTLAIFAALGAAIIYGLTHTIAKSVIPHYVQPFGFILLRVLGAGILFWLISFWGPKEKIATSDWLRILACSLFGMTINMLMYFKGLSLSTPINSSVIITIAPILVMLFSAFLINEKITWLKTTGIFFGLVGALSLILFGAEIRQDAPNIPLGNTMFLINATSYSIYLVMVKPLTAKYHPLTLMKWLFLAALLFNFPVTISEFIEIQWSTLPYDVIWKMLFVVVGTTFMTYLLNIYAMKQLAASTIGAFIYLQPLIAIFFAIVVGADALNFIKLVAAIAVFIGVYLVSKKPKRITNQQGAS
ncbi:DMT family transporter [Leptobacterium sp. I13]|uniref:DMT family transporter n=1 Tax=Leptobacterium meishanense TaxID=3128904 RepID=UPI0030EE7105